MANANKLSGIVNKINKLPDFARSRALTLFFGKVVPFTGTAGIRIESLTHDGCVISIANKRRVQNHIGGVHAVASLLLAESATGFLVGLNVPDDKVPVIKTAHAEYTRRAKGDMTVEARLSEEQRERIRTEDKGDVSVPVIIRDSENKEPIEIEMIWAWTPKRR
jgi:acyl-coenzyme A thioesterase PaaI-like protein